MDAVTKTMSGGRMVSAERVSIVPRTGAEWFLAITRIIIGYMWFQSTLWKLPPTFGCSPDFAFTTDLAHPTAGLCDFIGRQATAGSLDFYRAFLTGLVEPNIRLFGLFVYLTETAIALSLLFGFLTRLGGLVGALQSLVIGVGFLGVPNEWVWTYIFMLLINLALAVFAAGRTFGVDVWLRQRFAQQPGWLGELVRRTT